MTLAFAENNHRYQDQCVIIPSVGQIMKLCGLDYTANIPPHILDPGRLVGKTVHLACQWLDQGCLDLDSLGKEIVGFVVSYQKFREYYSPEWLDIEKPMQGEYQGLGFAGTPDRIGRIQDKSAVADLKTSSKPQPAWAIQLAGYQFMSGVDLRMTVWLQKDGSFEVISYTDTGDEEAFKASVTLAHWRIAHGTKIPD